MKVTVIMKDFSDAFYSGRPSETMPIPSFTAMSAHDKWAKCKQLAADRRVTMKIMTGQFSDAVDLNHMLKSPVDIEFTIEPRRGYKLATFHIEKA